MHYNNGLEPCDIFSNASGGMRLTPPAQYYGCLGSDSIARQEITTTASSEFSDCFDCAAATLAVGRLIVESKGIMTEYEAKLIVAKDMYESGLGTFDDLNSGGSSGCEETTAFRGRRLSSGWGLQDTDAPSTLSRPLRMAAETGNVKRWFSATLTKISFAAARFEAGRFYYFTKTQADEATKDETSHFQPSYRMRDRCVDDNQECAGLLYNGVCNDGGFADVDNVGNCSLGTDCTDCTPRT